MNKLLLYIRYVIGSCSPIPMIINNNHIYFNEKAYHNMMGMLGFKSNMAYEKYLYSIYGAENMTIYDAEYKHFCEYIYDKNYNCYVFISFHEY